MRCRSAAWSCSTQLNTSSSCMGGRAGSGWGMAQRAKAPSRGSRGSAERRPSPAQRRLLQPWRAPAASTHLLLLVPGVARQLQQPLQQGRADGQRWERPGPASGQRQRLASEGHTWRSFSAMETGATSGAGPASSAPRPAAAPCTAQMMWRSQPIDRPAIAAPCFPMPSISQRVELQRAPRPISCHLHSLHTMRRVWQ